MRTSCSWWKAVPPLACSAAPWTGRGGGAAAPQRPLHAGAALCCLVGSMLVLCAVFARRLAESCSIRTGAGDATLVVQPEQSTESSPAAAPAPAETLGDVNLFVTPGELSLIHI